MSNVVAPQLFAALEVASQQFVAAQNGFGGAYAQFAVVSTDYGFKTTDNPVTDTSIWYFHADRPPVICHFYQLQTYLNRGFTVDDITTAIQTGWKMAGITSPPELNYHKETNLLIAFGKPDDLDTIQNVLNTLPQVYLDRDQLGNLVIAANKIFSLESQVHELANEVSALRTNSAALPEKSSGK
jgi:hypothetical protein